MANNLTDLYLPTGTLNSVDDSYAGGAVNNGLRNPGQLGRIIELNDAEAAALSTTSTGTLRAGTYQYVRFKSGSTASNAVGQVVFWDDLAAYQVTPDISSATALGKWAGITLNAVTKGNYGWIQIGGIATVKCAATVTDTTDGALGLVTQTPANTVDSLADATAVTGKLAKSIMGVFLAAPANGGSKLFQLNRNALINPKR